MPGSSEGQKRPTAENSWSMKSAQTDSGRTKCSYKAPAQIKCNVMIPPAYITHPTAPPVKSSVTANCHHNSPRGKSRYIIVTYQATNEKEFVSDNRFLSTLFFKTAPSARPGTPPYWIEKPHFSLKNQASRAKVSW